MEFEFNESKSRANKAKHGMDFVEAQSLWNDPYRLEIPAKTRDESRLMVIGRAKEKIWSAVVTFRGLKVIIISVRRSRDEEAKIYESEEI